MRAMERKLRRKRLDAEMKPFRKAAREKNPTNDLLRIIRQSLRFPLTEIAEKMGVCTSVVLGIEERELTNTATVRSMAREAKAMGCKMVYGIVPEGGGTLEELAEERLWAEILGVGRAAGQQVSELASQRVLEQLIDDRLQLMVGSEQVKADSEQIGPYNLRVTGDSLQLTAGSGHSKATDE